MSEITGTQLLNLLEAALKGNAEQISALTKSCQDGQAVITQLHLALKGQENVCNATDLKVGIISDDVAKIVTRLDKIDAWQKIRLPFIVGLITLIITGLGFFLSLQQIAKNPHHSHIKPPAIVQSK